MLDNDQLIAVAEVLGFKDVRQANLPSNLPSLLWSAIPPIPDHPDHRILIKDYLASLDACFADIVRQMRNAGFCLELYQRGDCSWVAKFDHEKRRSYFVGQDPSAPRAIVKAFLIYNNRWIE